MLTFTLNHFVAVFALIASMVTGEPAFYVPASTRDVLEAQTTRAVEKSAPHTRAQVITPLKAQVRVCNLEADYSPHGPVDSKKQEKGVSAFCDLLRGKGGYLEPGMESQRVEFQDTTGRHHYKIYAALNCHELMRDNYLMCDNGGVGGKVQVGCLIYTYNGGIMPGRVYDW
ncbi:hypothetical protein LZ31DRAFT_608783 [Colletotrichum somersetense]|nr:hypothetical protein LZ31DRAFT_608783 [Colletotrichum somersetense]